MKGRKSRLENKKEASKTWNSAFDLLRILSAFSVVVIHVTTKYILANEVGSVDFNIANFINSVSRFGVPVFVMISGAIFLSPDKEVRIGRLWTKNILRLFAMFWIWSFAYYVFQSLYLWDYAFWKEGLVRTLVGCVYASEHFWFIFMIIGLYALVPVLRTWIHNASKKEAFYFVGLFVVFHILRMTFVLLIDKDLIQELLEMVEIVTLTGYIGYFVLGYILIRYGIPKWCKIVLYCMVPVGIAVNYHVSAIMSAKAGVYTPGIYDSYGIFTFFHVVALFVFVTDLFARKKNCFPAKLGKNLALDTLGIYIMHIAVLEVLVQEGIIYGQVPVVVGIAGLSLICFILPALAAGLLRRIPFVGRYLC